MTSAIIVAAGRGTRMGPNIDKLFLEVSGAPVVAHTWERFDEVESIDEIVLVIRERNQRVDCTNRFRADQCESLL